MEVVALIFSLAAVTAGAELLVRGASMLALRMGLSPLFVGLTVVGFGTSTPELGASLYATLAGAGNVSIGNVVGSNLFNIGVILGATALSKPIRIGLSAVRGELLVTAGATLAPYLALLFGGELPRWSGPLLLAALAAALVGAYRAGKRATAAEQALADAELGSSLAIGARPPDARGPLWKQILLILAGLALLFAGSRAFVSAALSIAAALGIPDLVVGLTIVAAGTSLPELVTSIVAAVRGNPDIAIGNVLGSNLFNLLGILGVCACVRPQAVPTAVLAIDLPVLLLATLALFPILWTGGSISRREGLVLLVGYAIYLTALAWRGP